MNTTTPIYDSAESETTIFSLYDNQNELPIAQPEHWSPLRGVLKTACGSVAEGGIVRILKQDVLLESNKQLKVGAAGEFEVRDIDGVVQFTTKAVVHWADLHDRYVGLFLNEHVPATLRNELDNDKRQQLRFPLNVAATAWWSGDAEASDVQIRDYSLDGMALETRAPVDVGSRVLVSLIGDDERPIMLSGRICWQVRTRLRYLVGCALDNGQGRRIRSRSEGPKQQPLRKVV